jgi:hypothetical protein
VFKALLAAWIAELVREVQRSRQMTKREKIWDATARRIVKLTFILVGDRFSRKSRLFLMSAPR